MARDSGQDDQCIDGYANLIDEYLVLEKLARAKSKEDEASIAKQLIAEGEGIHFDRLNQAAARAEGLSRISELKER